MLVDVCIAGLLYEYRPYLENLQISSFTRLVEVARRTSMSMRKPSKGLTSQTMSTPRQPWRRRNKKVKVAVVKEPKKVVKGKKRERSNIPPPLTMSTTELYSILEAWLKDGVVVLPACKHKPTEEEKRSPLYCRYHKRCNRHTMDCYALRNILHDRVAKGDLVIKAGKMADPKMHTPEVAMIFFLGRKDPIEEEAGNMASNNSVPSPLVDEEMVKKIK